MKVSAHKFLAVALAGSLAVVYCQPWHGPDKPPAPLDSNVNEALSRDPLSEAWPEVVLLRAVVKDRLAREVADGRRTLWVAAALFRELNLLSPEPAKKPPRIISPMTIPPDTEEGWLCRQVVDHVHAALEREPTRAATVVARLEAEFFAALRSPGTIRLPDPSSLEPVEELLRQARTWLAAQKERRTGR